MKVRQVSGYGLKVQRCFGVLIPSKPVSRMFSMADSSGQPVFKILGLTLVCPSQVSRLTKDDLVALAKMIDGFLASDIGQMTQIVVFTAFPELSIAKRVGLPIVRAFIKKVKAI